MAEVFNPQLTANLTNQQSITAAIDNNFASLAAILLDVLSRSGVSANQMTASLDMNSNSIINPGPLNMLSHTLTGLPTAVNPSDAVPLSQVQSMTAGGGGAVASVSNTDGTLTIAPTTGAIVASLTKAIDVFLVIGDSNAVGQGSSASSPIVPPGMVLQYAANGTISDANDPTKSAVNVAQNSNTGSMWPAFGISYGRRVGLVLTGKGGSTQSIAADLGVGNGNWESTAGGGNYALSLAAINAAMIAFRTAGYNPTFKGIIYILGSNDGAQINASVATATQYTNALTTMVANYRAATIDGSTHAHMPFFMNVIGADSSQSEVGYSQIRAAQLAFAASDKNTTIAFTGMYSFSFRGMMQAGTAHPTQAGYNILGTAIGSACIPTIPANIPYQLFSSNAGIGGVPLTGTVLQVIGTDATQSVIQNDAYAGAANISLRRADGTLQAPSAVQSGEVVGIYGVQTYGATTFGSTNQGALLFSATQNHTDSAKGVQAGIYTTANGAATPTLNLLVDQAGNVQINSGTTFNWNADTFLGRVAAASLRLGAADAASPVAQTLSVQNVATGTTNTAGVDFVIAGSKGTGTGAGGAIRLQVAAAGSTGSSQNALASIASIMSNGNIGLGKETNPQFGISSIPSLIFSNNATTGFNVGNIGSGIFYIGVDGGVTVPGFNGINVGNGVVNNFFRMDGTLASPSNLGTGELIGALLFGGFGNSAYQGGRCRILVNTSEAWTTTFGSYLQFDAVPTGGARGQVLRLQAGAIVGAGTTDPGAGNLTASGFIRAMDGTAIPAGGTQDAGFMFSSTAHLGVFFGSGVPTLSAAQGSLYVRTDGSSTSTRLYVNTNGTTGWTNVTTAT